MHENAGNIGYRLDFYEVLYRQLNVNIITFAYRGYSNSQGSPTEEGLKLDSDAIINHINKQIVNKKIDKDSIFLQGRSLGGAVALHMLVKNPHLFRGAIIENTFTSIPDMVDVIFFFARYFKGLILRNYWTSIDLVGRIENPLLFITGDQDEIVPDFMTHQLYDKAAKSVHKELYVVKDGTHNDTWYKGGNKYISRLKKFIEKAMTFN